MIKNKPLDIEKEAKEQLKRISHLPGFPKEALAIRDYIAAVCSLGDAGEVESLISDIVLGDWQRSPTAREIRTMAHSRAEQKRQNTASCSKCEGVGVVTVWKLVTYFGRTFKIKNTETLHDVHSQEQANERIKNLMAWLEQNPQPDNQTILTAAKRCACRAAA